MSTTLAAAPANRMWPVVWKLLYLRLLILVRGFRRSRLRRKIGMAAAGLVLIIFLGLIFFVSSTLLRFLTSPELATLTGDPGLVRESVPVLILSGAFIGILFTSFGVLLQALYLAGDMDFLLSAPIPIRAVFLAKLLQAILPNFGLICLFALPVLFGLGAAAGFSLLYYPTVVVLLSALALAAAGISSLLVMLAVRIVPARRVTELLGFIGGILSLVCSQSGQLAKWDRFSPQQAQGAMKLVTNANTSWSPLAWAGRGLVWIGEANWPAGLATTVAILVACGLIFAGTLVTAERLYHSGWASLHAVPHKKKSERRQRSLPPVEAMIGLIQQRLPSAMLQIIKKDLVMLRRDVRNMSQLVTPLILGVVYFVMLLRGGSDLIDGAGRAPAWMNDIFKTAAVYGNVGIALFVGWMLLSRLAGTGFSQEGKHYWMIKSAPVSRKELISSKFLVAFLPVTGLCWAFLLLTYLIQRPGISVLLFAVPVITLCVAGNAGINLTFGIIGANMNWEDPRQMQRGVSGCMGTLATMVYLPICLVLFFGPTVLGAALRLPVISGQLGGLAVGGVFSLACATIPLWMVRKKVDRLGEE